MALCQVKVGIVAPLTGPFAPWGKMIVDGAKLAETAINAGISTSGEKLELIIRDDQSNPARALEASKQLAVLDKVSALVGCPSSVAALASAPVASDNNLLMISFATGSSVTEKSRNILRLMGREDRLIRTVADHIAVKFLGKRVGAWLAPELAFARGLIESRGVKIENSATIESAEPELPAWIGQLDVVVASPIAARAIRQAPPGKPTFLMPSTLLDASLAPLLPLPNFIAITNPGADFFEAGPAIARRAGYEQPEFSGYVIYSYAAVELVSALSRKAGNDKSDGRRLVDLAQKEEPIRTVLGNLRFDENRELRGWRFAMYGAASAPDVCKTPECKNYDTCPSDCPVK